MTLDDLTDSIVEVLEPHSVFFNAGRDDDTRYYIPGEVIEGLSLLLTSVVLPVLSNVFSDEIKQRLDFRRAKRRASAEEVEKAVVGASGGPAPDPAALEEAQRAAAGVLMEHGWPAKAAEEDAGRVVASLASGVWPG